MSAVLSNQPVASRNKGDTNRLWTSDFVLYVTLATLVWIAWLLSRRPMFKPGDDLGYWIGVTGSVMMLLLFTYPLRKHFRFTHGWGKAKWWLWAHMVLGVAGPMLILLHSNFQIGSLNAGVALYSMVIVAASGVVGRFIYSRINRGLRGEQSDFKTLQTRAGLDQSEARSLLAFAPEVEQTLREFGESELKSDSNFLGHLRRVFWLPIQQWLVYRDCVQKIQSPLERLAKHHAWSLQDLQRRERHAHKLVWRYVHAVVRVAQYTAYERLFSLWHVAHIPFVYMLVISAIVHVIAVHAY